MGLVQPSSVAGVCSTLRFLSSLNVAASAHHGLKLIKPASSMSSTSTGRSESSSCWSLALDLTLNSFSRCPYCVASVNPITSSPAASLFFHPPLRPCSPQELLLSCQGIGSLVVSSPHFPVFLGQLHAEAPLLHTCLHLASSPSSCQQWPHRPDIHMLGVNLSQASPSLDMLLMLTGGSVLSPGAQLQVCPVTDSSTSSPHSQNL